MDEQNEHLHIEQYGCKTVKYTLLSPTYHDNGIWNDHVDVCWCVLHRILSCRCGWEFRWHGGTKSEIKNPNNSKHWKEKDLFENYFDTAPIHLKQMILITRQKYVLQQETTSQM